METEKKKFGDTAVGKFLGNVAPGIVSLVGDVFPPAKLLSNIFKQQPDILPEQRLEFEKLLQGYEAEERQAYLADVANAREMQKAALNQSDVFSKRYNYYLSAASIVLGFAYVFLITFVSFPKENQRFADTILGVVISLVFGTIYNFYFGSSKSSSDKNELLKGLTSQKTDS